MSFIDPNLPHQVEMILGLPGIGETELLGKAREMGAPILISANSLSRWKKVRGIREWDGFNTASLANADGMRVRLDSAGFVAMVKYNAFPWSIDDYVQLAASYPFELWSAMDYCVEEEIAGTQALVEDRISRTVAANVQCRRLALRHGIENTFMPVIQGRAPKDYLRCIDRLPLIEDHKVIGVGSMCRRHVHGPNGILAVVSTLDRKLAGTDIKLHLFGLKSQGAEAVRAHPRVASVDSQAYGTAARWDALHAGHSKTNAFLAGVMESWMERQLIRLSKPRFQFQDTLPLVEPAPAPMTRWQRCELQAREELRELVEEGELEHDMYLERLVYELAGEIYSNGGHLDA